MGMKILNHLAEMVETTRDQFFNIILDHIHLTITEAEIAHDDRSHEMLETKVTRC